MKKKYQFFPLKSKKERTKWWRQSTRTLDDDGVLRLRLRSVTYRANGLYCKKQSNFMKSEKKTHTQPNESSEKLTEKSWCLVAALSASFSANSTNKIATEHETQSQRDGFNVCPSVGNAKQCYYFFFSTFVYYLHAIQNALRWTSRNAQSHRLNNYIPKPSIIHTKWITFQAARITHNITFAIALCVSQTRFIRYNILLHIEVIVVAGRAGLMQWKSSYYLNQNRMQAWYQSQMANYACACCRPVCLYLNNIWS